MQSYYEINVSHMGRHFFATAPRSLTNEADARFMVQHMSARYPAPHYKVTCTYWKCVGEKMKF